VWGLAVDKKPDRPIANNICFNRCCISLIARAKNR
jgi:hypothetical protein